MILIIGLGNPGNKYKKTRHNIGFRVIDALEKSLDFARDKEIILFKPQTFMNNSGKAVKHLITNYKIPFTHMWVIHDDIDLPLGTIRVSKNSSSGGHKGVQSIINELGTPNKSLRDSTGQAKNFVRIRIGIKPEFKINTERFVLQNFTKAEEKIIEKVIKKVIETIKESLETGIKKTTISIPCPTHERQIFSQK